MGAQVPEICVSRKLSCFSKESAIGIWRCQIRFQRFAEPIEGMLLPAHVTLPQKDGFA
jgi:hypothetical protein